ncbi:MAG: hypothetical protein FWB87_13720 [Defluviitaleaceae bacterium]|nr:hypothetical protein [Defluviitaleaceae bacterium]
MLKDLMELKTSAEKRAKRYEKEINNLYEQLINKCQKRKLKDKVHDLGICGYEIYVHWCIETAKAQASEAVIDAIEREAVNAVAGKETQKNLVDGLITDVIIGASDVNFRADDGDRNRNRVVYGSVSKAAQVLCKLGINVDIYDLEDENGFIRIARIDINGKESNYHNGHYSYAQNLRERKP